MARRPTVWVLKEQMVSGSPMDYSAAYEYGDVEFITDFDPPVGRTRSTIGAQWRQAVLRFIDSVDSENDYIILTGAPLAIFMCGLIMAQAGIMLKILVWRREQGKYVVFDPLLTLEPAPSTL
jgi:hypothetical protein